jgi:Tfp pilus assembly protein PilV
MQRPSLKTLQVTYAPFRDARGFTLVETFVAVLILVFAIAGPLTLATRGLNSTLTARDQLTASYLAQEAVEHIRYLRDNNILDGVSWTTNLAACLNQDCRVDIWASGTGLTACSGTCPPLKYDSTNTSTLYRYQYTTGSDTSFVRTVRIDNTSEATEKTIYVRVAWTTGSIARSIEIRENFTNWAEGFVTPQ